MWMVELSLEKSNLNTDFAFSADICHKSLHVCNARFNIMNYPACKKLDMLTAIPYSLLKLIADIRNTKMDAL